MHGSRMPATEVIRTGRLPRQEEWILNEILFDPRPTAYVMWNASTPVKDSRRFPVVYR